MKIFQQKNKKLTLPKFWKKEKSGRKKKLEN